MTHPIVVWVKNDHQSFAYPDFHDDAQWLILSRTHNTSSTVFSNGCIHDGYEFFPNLF